MHNPASPVPLLTVQELAHLLETAPESGTLIDVREPAEVAQAKIQGSQHIPSKPSPKRSNPRQKRHLLDAMQIRNAQRQRRQYMLSIGFTDVHNVQGGIDAWINAGL